MCQTKHANPYCSLELPPLKIDVSHEHWRIADLQVKRGAMIDNGTLKNRRRREHLRLAIVDSMNRIQAVALGCGVDDRGG